MSESTLRDHDTSALAVAFRGDDALEEIPQDAGYFTDMSGRACGAESVPLCQWRGEREGGRAGLVVVFNGYRSLLCTHRDSLVG